MMGRSLCARSMRAEACLAHHSSSEVRHAGGGCTAKMKKQDASRWQGDRNQPQASWLTRIVSYILAITMFILAFVILFSGW
jgi:hypothetical protein